METYPQIIMNLLILPIVFIIGAIVTVEDFKEGKIRNKWIKLGIYFGLVYFFILIVISLLGNYEIISFEYLTLSYYLEVLINTLIAFILGFLIWSIKLWAGGDAKLYALFVFLIPLYFYTNSYYKVFPALNLLINIFIPIFLFLIIKFLIYPFSLFKKYLTNPELFKEYFSKFRSNNKIKKEKFKEILNAGLSFILILVFFQILRTRINEFLNPYLGQLVVASYFLMGFLIFNPLRKFLKKYLIAVILLLFSYFVFGYFKFKDQLFDDLYKIFAIQMIFMMSYFYIFKYGRSLGRFLYDSAEVKVIPLDNLQAGMYINKGFIKKIMGNRLDLDSFKEEIGKDLEEDDRIALLELISQKCDPKLKGGNEKQLFNALRNLRPDMIFSLIKKKYKVRKEKAAQELLLEKLKLTQEQRKDLKNVLSNTDEVQDLLKSIKGKISQEQVVKLKEMIKQRNQEIKAQGKEPIEQIILHKTFSFAPFMLLGVIITLVTQTNLIHLIYQYILHR